MSARIWRKAGPVYAVQLALLVAALGFRQYALLFVVGSLWNLSVVLRLGTWWSKLYPLWLGLLVYLTLQEPFARHPWLLIPTTLGIFHALAAAWLFVAPVRRALDHRLSLVAMTRYIGHRVMGAYFFSTIIDERSAGLVAAHDPLRVMNASWAYTAGLVDLTVAFAAPLLAALLAHYSTAGEPTAKTALAAGPPRLPRWLLSATAVVNLVGLADFCVVGAGYASLLLPGPLQMKGVAISVLPLTRFPLAVLVMGLAPVSMLFHVVSLGQIRAHWRAASAATGAPPLPATLAR
jgi:hypothetical protein